MKKLGLIFMLFLPFFCFAQVNESFTDGNFTINPIWTGTTSNFLVNSSLQLQSQAAATSVSYLFTPSEAMDNAVWECWVKITYSTSSSNYAAIYLVSDKNDLTTGCNGYYVQIGGTNDEVSLFVQEGTKKTKIIDGVDKRTDGNPVELRIKVTRSKDGKFTLYSKLPSESDFVLEGSAEDNTVKTSSYFGVLFSNTTTTGSAYYFDDIVVTGTKVVDNEAPVWNSLNLILPDKMVLKFSEPMDFSAATFEADNGLGTPESKTNSADNTSIELTFSTDFKQGALYQLQVSGLKDLAGNALPDGSKSIGIIESAVPGDVVFNEVMFDNPLNSLEYIEFANTSEKVIDLSGMIFTTRKTDGTLNTGNKIPTGTFLLPHTYLAVCENADSVRNYHHCPQGSNIISTSWTSLNNESATLVLCNGTKDTIFDEFTYNTKWHHVMVKNPKGVALEKINPLLPANDPESWHSASSETNFGTPGYANSQYRNITTQGIPAKTVWVDPEAFSPDNDGVDDICFIRYKTETSGYVANVLILNPLGVKVAEITQNSLLSSEGFFTWDGKTLTGKNANVGIYVLYFEMFNPINGKKMQFKLPIVVSSR